MTNPFDQAQQDETQDSSAGVGFDLADFDDDYAEAEAPSYEEVPDGQYLVRVDSVALTETKKGQPMLKWTLLVLSGTHEGRKIYKNSVITSASLPFVKGDLQLLGVALARFSDLPNHLEDLLDKTIETTKRTNGEFSNLYFNNVVTVAAGEGASF